MTKHDHHEEELFMRRALALAERGAGHVSPNPMVGCVIVHDNRIIGEGWHKVYGGPHAEVNAITNVKEKALLPESTVYVTLEPCSHFGKTPPCADMLIYEKVKRVVVANLDSNPLVGGKGLQKLRAAGIEVVTGICEAAGRAMNKRFFTFMEKQRPYIILKWAETADGFVARENYDSKWISSIGARQVVHRWRAEEDAILVGMRTAQHDNPRLNVRDWTGRNPVRIVIDRFLRLDKSLHLFDGMQRTLCYNVLKHEEDDNLSLVRINDGSFLPELLHHLFSVNIQSVIVEGGAHTLTTFIESGMWDEARIFQSKKVFLRGIKAPAITGRLATSETLDGDVLNIYYPE
ncbi:MAG TPA: bifunctional diaminohydroxyphosphoribosylaminopyrimidine deaminase/5-amino-6-(5-phosphoribosylamino)uracil reductase RibD [Ohtaekwangia sp.]|nr:bifunctional diaminohydroxyphosphoribosylaminopyrimidine deaminase/5-amino-6-(5-phosphoribosylamino)uracil reductase RibD [Ohtaekwangia sp.]